MVVSYSVALVMSSSERFAVAFCIIYYFPDQLFRVSKSANQVATIYNKLLFPIFQNMASNNHQRKGRQRDRHQNAGHDVKLSKLLSFTLRHGAVKQGITIAADGYVDVNELLLHEKFKSFTEQQVRDVVAQNDKQRFELAEDEETKKLKIRATQGHTMSHIGEKALDLKPVNPDELPQAIHGTNGRVIEIIKKKGLSRMGRNHIHMAVDLPGKDGVISGMRQSCSWLVYVDIKEAHKDGLQFFRSKNNVILCSGNEDGFIKPKYLKFKKRG